MIDSEILFQIHLIEKWLETQEQKVKIVDTKVHHLYSNRFRADLYGASVCSFGLNKPIVNSYFLHVNSDEVIDKTIRG